MCKIKCFNAPKFKVMNRALDICLMIAILKDIQFKFIKINCPKYVIIDIYL